MRTFSVVGRPLPQKLAIATFLSLAVAVHGDVLELKNGTVLNGKYVGGSAGVIKFQTDAGVQAIETGQAVVLTFTTAAGETGAAAPAAAPAAEPQSATLAAGTTLLVRMVDSISSKNKAGTRFTTKLEYDLPAGGTSVVKGGTTLYGIVKSSTQARRAVGKSTLDVRLSQIIINGQPVSVTTSGYQQASQASIAKAAKGAAAGAAIGAIAGDAGTGAAIGATVGALKKGETITITPGTLLEFTLSQPVTFKL